MGLIPYFDSKGITLYHGDAREIIPSLDTKNIDLVLSDPPYGINNNADYSRFTGGQKPSNTFKNISGDNTQFDPSSYLDFPNVILWGAHCFSNQLPLGSWLIWCKKRDSQLGKYLGDCEVAWMKGGHGIYLYHHVWLGFDRESERGKTLHPNQKPVKLMEWCLSKKSNANVILDPYCGSGPVGIAAINSGKTYVGIELEEQYCELAALRFEKAQQELVTT